MSKDNDTPKRGGLVPVCDIPFDVPGVGRTLTAKRQAHHFTTLDQVTQLVAARDADPELGYMARLLTLCSLPRTNQGDLTQYKRVNGPYTLVMFSSGETKLPYGNLPRLLLAWVCTEAVRTQSREIILGRFALGRLHAECRCPTTMAARCGGGSGIRCSGSFVRSCGIESTRMRQRVSGS